jgi:hypothetical protein
LQSLAGTAYAGCEIPGNVSIVGNEFPAIHTVANGAAACTGGDVKVNLTADHQKINVDGMSGNPAEYTSAIIANSSLVALMNADVVRPLNDLVAAHGQDIPQEPADYDRRQCYGRGLYGECADACLSQRRAGRDWR